MTTRNKRMQAANAIDAAYEMGRNRWRGCDWNTSFGSMGLDLNGMKPHQTRWLAGATSGEEAKHWEQAAEWLDRVARDAQQAEAAAAEAAAAWQADERTLALEKIRAAVALEARYRNPFIWKPLLNAITNSIRLNLTSQWSTYGRDAQNSAGFLAKNS
ncbi:hypothetical protein Poly24_01330 [Rosistilla carotiformis]|uniref:Uncharacterized protein n=1 Tax=Rosistilla carotiformis TaxID=2528017 RepID=A0A518JLS7_9BACT|nr:hypothetical protein [Rosistilla carotiformis]QDV66447.1 hypothetical protein Poly24_01330 [Rosistilla carotiformis]